MLSRETPRGPCAGPCAASGGGARWAGPLTWASTPGPNASPNEAPSGLQGRCFLCGRSRGHPGGGRSTGQVCGDPDPRPGEQGPERAGLLWREEAACGGDGGGRWWAGGPGPRPELGAAGTGVAVPGHVRVWRGRSSAGVTRPRSVLAGGVRAACWLRSLHKPHGQLSTREAAGLPGPSRSTLVTMTGRELSTTPPRRGLGLADAACLWVLALWGSAG